MPTPAIMKRIVSVLGVQNELTRCFLAEFLGTFILCIFIDGGLAQVILTKSSIAENTLRLSIGLGLGVTFGIYVAFGISGGHLNPTVTVGIASVGRFPWKHVPAYLLAQFLGAFAASGIVYISYFDATRNFDGDFDLTATIYTTHPASYISLWAGFFDQIITCGLLMTVVLGLFDMKNCGLPYFLIPLFIGVLVANISLTHSMNTGAPLSSARDLAGRLFATMIGHGWKIWFHEGQHWWWIPTFGPLVGGIIGAWIYFLFVEAHHQSDQVEDKKQCDEDIKITLCKTSR